MQALFVEITLKALTFLGKANYSKKNQNKKNKEIKLNVLKLNSF